MSELGHYRLTGLATLAIRCPLHSESNRIAARQRIVAMGPTADSCTSRLPLLVSAFVHFANPGTLLVLVDHTREFSRR